MNSSSDDIQHPSSHVSFSYRDVRMFHAKASHVNPFELRGCELRTTCVRRSQAALNTKPDLMSSSWVVRSTNLGSA